jgi:hypothetical protein
LSGARLLKGLTFKMATMDRCRFANRKGLRRFECWEGHVQT